MNFIKENLASIVTIWVPAFLLFGQSAGVFLKSLGLKNDLKGVEKLFSSIDRETIKSLGLIEKVPALINETTNKFLGRIEEIGNEFESYMEELFTNIKNEISDIENRMSTKINEIETRQHEQIVKIRRVNNGQEVDEDVSEIWSQR